MECLDMLMINIVGMSVCVVALVVLVVAHFIRK